MALQYNIYAVTGNMNTLVAGSVIAGTALNLGDNARVKLKTLSALVSATAATATLTVAGKWQVSNDNSTWVDLSNGSQNAAAVVLTTGTATIATKAIPAPDAIFGWKWARFALVTGVATGATADLYSIGYCQRTTRSLDG